MGSNIPAPLCQASRPTIIDDGTMCLMPTSSPMPTGIGDEFDFDLSSAIQVTLTTSGNQTEFPFSVSPAMPTVSLNAVVSPALLPGSRSSFDWTIKVVFDGSQTKHGKESPTLTLNKHTTLGFLTLGPDDWGRMCGGQLTIDVDVTINGFIASARLVGLTIVGKNPDPKDVRQALGTDTLRRIAHLESDFRQFGDDNWPLFSKDNKGGAGIMQITPASEEQKWNWKSNVQAGIDKFNDSFRLAAVYVGSMRKSAAFAKLVKDLNDAREVQKLPALTVTVPDFTDDQRLRDAIRGYNGWAGKDPIDNKLHLHEFRIALEANGQLKVNIKSGTNQAEAIWEQVPVASRPQDKGDPNYVQDVLAKSP